MARHARHRPRAERQRRFEHLYERHRGDVYRALRRDLSREDAEDASQTAFLNAYGALMRGGDPESPRAWLLTIAENVRRRRFAAERPGAELDDELVAAPEAEVTAHELRAALERLPSEQRQALLLRELAGLSYSEIADRQHATVGSVQMLLFRARKRLRDELGAARSRAAGIALPGWLQHLLANPGPAAVGGRTAGVVAAAVLAVIVAHEAGVVSSRPDAGPVAEDSVGRTSSPGAFRTAAARSDEAWDESPAAAARRVRQAWPPRDDSSAPPARRARDAAAGDGSSVSTSAVRLSVPAPSPAGVAPSSASVLPSSPTPPPAPATVRASPIPEVRVPTVTVPPATVPEVTVPTVTVPEVTVPEVTLPPVTVPTVTVPEVTLPPVTVPEVTVPEVTVPTVTVPEVTVPELTVPGTTLLTPTAP